jgi:dTDP-4-dehydrorhamnose reductase
LRIGVTGARGMLARTLIGTLASRGHEVLAWTEDDLDITRAEAVRRTLGDQRPDAVVQCAAYTAVDAAETEETLALRINADGTRHVAEACAEVGALLVYPSTDYVFAGSADRPYRPTDPTAPLSAYGRTKLAGEHAARAAGATAVVRTSWLYGAGGRHFVETITRMAGERDHLEVVDDQVGRPTWTGSLAVVIAELVERGVTGTFHATDGGEPVSWHGFARAILEEQGIRTPVEPVDSTRFPRPARRPAYSVLDCSETEAAIGRPLPHWRDALRRYLAGASTP